jgi:hypothetical protein
VTNRRSTQASSRREICRLAEQRQLRRVSQTSTGEGLADRGPVPDLERDGDAVDVAGDRIDRRLLAVELPRAAAQCQRSTTGGARAS